MRIRGEGEAGIGGYVQPTIVHTIAQQAKQHGKKGTGRKKCCCAIVCLYMFMVVFMSSEFMTYRGCCRNV